MEYKSVVKLLDGFWSTPWEGLTADQQHAWQEAAFPLSKWCDLSARQREWLMTQHDHQNDPANEKESEFWFNNACDIAETECETKKLEALPEQTALEIEAKKRLLADAGRRLADLKSVQFEPLTVSVNSHRSLTTGKSKTSRTRTDGLKMAMLAGIARYRASHQTNPTARALFDWIATNDETGIIEDFNQDADVITWRRSDGGLSDTCFKSFQARFTKLKKIV